MKQSIIRNRSRSILSFFPAIYMNCPEWNSILFSRLLQNRDINIRLKPLYKFSLSASKDIGAVALRHRYENLLIDKFIADAPINIAISNSDSIPKFSVDQGIETMLYGDTYLSAGDPKSLTEADRQFIR